MQSVIVPLGQNPAGFMGSDVKAVIADGAGYVAIGRIARLQESPREGPESRRKSAFHCEQELGLIARSGSSYLSADNLPGRDALEQEDSGASTRKKTVPHRGDR